jgi:hypothetical protein
MTRLRAARTSGGAESVGRAGAEAIRALERADRHGHLQLSHLDNAVETVFDDSHLLGTGVASPPRASRPPRAPRATHEVRPRVTALSNVMCRGG